MNVLEYLIQEKLFVSPQLYSVQKTSREENMHLAVGCPHLHLYSRINSRFEVVQIKMLNKLDFS